jgi:hypothetical protein
MSRKRCTLCRVGGGGKAETLEGDAGRIVEELEKLAIDLENVLDTIEFRDLALRWDALANTTEEVASTGKSARCDFLEHRLAMRPSELPRVGRERARFHRKET